MNKKKIAYYLGMTLIILAGCNQSAKEIAEIVSERDSLKNVVKNQNHRIDNLDDIIEIVNGSLDSIATQEGNLFISTKVEGGTASREDVLQNVSRLESLIASQKKKISELEDRLGQEAKTQDENESKSDANLLQLIQNLKAQLENKDKQVAKLKAELEKKDTDLSQLRIKTEQQSRTIIELDKRANMQQEALKRQDAMLNQCYMIIATKKELEKRGIIKKGKVVAQNALDRSMFSKVDIRKLTEISFTAKKPKLITSMPESAYEITTDGKHNYTLSITNPNAFWSVSNYLIIQTD
ncbi:MAG: hypothetical protein K2K81_08975 [Muribaculaceae bacterium]|nr:hypothetical protein [Muribaculaceae bacterium]